MKLKTLAWTQIILGIYFFVFEGIWGFFNNQGILPNLAENIVPLGFGLFAFLTGLYNLNNKK